MVALKKGKSFVLPLLVAAKSARVDGFKEGGMAALKSGRTVGGVEGAGG
jgi:hypothetical protein